jgi:chaperonin GroES
MKLKPLGDHIVVKPMEEAEVKKGGIIIPDTAKEKPSRGEVVAAGSGKILDDGKKKQMEVKVGDKILYSKYGGTEIKMNDDELLIMTEEDVLAIIEG